MLVGKQICKAFGKEQVIKDVSITVAPGEIAAIIGPSGSGKSTFLRALAMVDPPDSGTISVNGTTYGFPRRNNGDQPCPWPLLTFVFQQLFLWPHLSIRENIALPLRKLNAPDVDARVDKLIHSFLMEDYAGRYPNQASVGQRQRAAIARAVALNPKYLLLDEITSALDVEHVSLVLGFLKDLAQHGTAIVLVTHLIGFAEQAAKQILFMEGGTFVEEGGREILDAPKTERLARFLSLVHKAK